MKTADQLWLDCEDILKLLKSCVEESGWKARYLGKCSKLSSSFSTCQLKYFEQKRREHNIEARRKWENKK